MADEFDKALEGKELKDMPKDYAERLKETVLEELKKLQDEKEPKTK